LSNGIARGERKMSDESKNASDVRNAANQLANAPLTDEELDAASGGRITNIRVNANGITAGGPIPANAVAQ
jgi:hypothetical protein